MPAVNYYKLKYKTNQLINYWNQNNKSKRANILLTHQLILNKRKTKSFQYAMIMNIIVKPYIYIYKNKHVHTVNWLTLLFSANPKN